MSRHVRITAWPGGAVLVQLSGELDFALEAELRDGFASALHLSPHLVLDMRQVEFLDCAALGAMVWARNRSLADDGSVVLVSPAPLVRRLLDLTGLGEAFPILPDLRAAELSSVPSRDLGAPS